MICVLLSIFCLRGYLLVRILSDFLSLFFVVDLDFGFIVLLASSVRMAFGRFSFLQRLISYSSHYRPAVVLTIVMTVPCVLE